MSAKKKATTQTKADSAAHGTKPKARASKSAGRKSGQLSALDAATRVLGEEGRAIT